MSTTQYMMLLVDRRSGRVLDCSKINDEYSWSVRESVENMLKNHDLTQNDLVIRAPTLTAPLIITDVEVDLDGEDISPELDTGPEPQVAVGEPNYED